MRHGKGIIIFTLGHVHAHLNFGFDNTQKFSRLFDAEGFQIKMRWKKCCVGCGTQYIYFEKAG